MFGKQLERVKKRTRELEAHVEENKRHEKGLTALLQNELEYFLEQNSVAKHVEVSSNGSLIVYLPQHVTLQQSPASNSDAVSISLANNHVGRYYLSEQKIFGGTTVLPCQTLEWVQHIFGDLMQAWHEAVATHDYESFECARTLRWIAAQVGGQWPDIITGNFPLK